MGFVFEDQQPEQDRFQFEDEVPSEPSPTWEAVKKTAEVLPASAAVAGAKFIKGVTLGAYEPEVPTAKKFLKEKGAYIGEEPIYPYAGKAAEMLGEFIPITGIMKIIGPVVKRVLSGAGMVKTAATESALAGLTYEAAKGAAQGKDPVQTLEEMGYAGPQWAGLGAVAGKLGEVLSRAKKAKPADVAADLKKAQEEIESTILYRPPEKGNLTLAPEWQSKPEYPTIPYTGTRDFRIVEPNLPARIGPRPPAAGFEIPPMSTGMPSPSPETKLLAPPPDWIPGRPVTVRKPSLETPPTAAGFKGPEKIFLQSTKGPVEAKWNAEKKVYEPIPESAKIEPMTRKTGAGEIPTKETPTPEGGNILTPEFDTQGKVVFSSKKTREYLDDTARVAEILTKEKFTPQIDFFKYSVKDLDELRISANVSAFFAMQKIRKPVILQNLQAHLKELKISESLSDDLYSLSMEYGTGRPGIIFKHGKNFFETNASAGTIKKASKTFPYWEKIGKKWIEWNYNKNDVGREWLSPKESLPKSSPPPIEGGGSVPPTSQPLSETAKRAQIKIEGKTVNGLANDILSETPAKQNAAIDTVKKAVENGEITQDEALHHVNNEMMNIATEKIKNGANLNVTLNAAQRAGMTFSEKIIKEVRPDAQAIFRKLKGEEQLPKATSYLEEKINYGGELRSRGSVIAEMQKQGIPQKGIDYYMMGANLRKKIRGESGKVDLDLLRHVTISGLGAATGATLDDENRWRGAIIGGASGFLISRGLLNKVLGRKFATETPTLAKEKIEVKPIKEGPITEPVLQLGINKSIANATEELFRAAGMKWDPSLLITDQITSALNVVPIGTFNKILADVGMPVEEFTKYYFRQSISKYAKGLGEWGAVVRRLMKNNPEAQKALDDISRAASDIDAMASAGNWWKRVDNIRRGLLVTQLSTAMRNAETQAGRVGMDVFEQAMDATLQRLFKTKVTTNPLDGLAQLAYLFRKGNKADVNKILGAFPEENNRLFLTYSSDIMKQRGEGIPEKVVDALNIANKFQEYAIRRTIFLSKLDQRMRAINQDLEKIVKNNELGKITEDDIKYAVNQALEFTWAQSPKYGGFAQRFISAVNSFPGLTYILPFPRFLTNAVRFQFEYSPLGAFKLLSPQERLAFKAGDMKTISRALIGTAMLGMAYQIRNSEYAGEKWYEINVKGKPIDTRAYNPFASYLFITDIIKKARDGSLYKLTSNDIIQGLLSTNLRAGTGLYTMDRVLDGFTDETKVEKAVNVLKQFGGEVAAGFMTPIRQVRDFLYGFDDMVLKETRGEPFLGPIKATLPGIEKGMEPRYKPTRAEPPKWQAPAARQLTGISIGEAKNTLEKELDRLGFDSREVYPSVGDAKADNLIRQKMGSISEEIALPLLEDPSYQNMGEAEKGYFLSQMIGKFRVAAKKEAQAEDPELFEKIVRIPKRKERFLKSLEGG